MNDDLDTPLATPVASEADDVLDLDGEASGAITRSEFKLLATQVANHEERLGTCETERVGFRKAAVTTGEHARVIIELQAQGQEMRTEFSVINDKLTEGNALKESSNKLKVEALDEQRALRADFNSAAKVFIRMVIAEMVKPKFLVAGVLGGLLFGFIAAAGQAFMMWVNK